MIANFEKLVQIKEKFMEIMAYFNVNLKKDF